MYDNYTVQSCSTVYLYYKRNLSRIEKTAGGERRGAKFRGERLIEVHRFDVQIGEHVLAVAHAFLARLLAARAQDHCVEAVLDVRRAQVRAVQTRTLRSGVHYKTK